MLNRSRRIDCPQCSGSNFWKGDPKPTDELHCRHCKAFVTTYDNYIHDRIRDEAAQTLARFIEADSEQDLMMLREVLAHPRRRRVNR
ncbi:MAG: hypothetical protein U9Q35_00850 [Pseudomonadota bacterium]|jgi:hypothetical protein|nr:hypothetical protein [Pseudomonadota bacterium]